MYKLLIVEDEENTRRALQYCVPWEIWGFEVEEAFDDGEDALEYMKENSCDVILTDIMMGRMNGLEMIENIREFLPNIKIVILSGYSNFNYVKKALQCQVLDYLLKPVDDDELIRVFRRIRETLDEEAKERDAQTVSTGETIELIQKSFLKMLLSAQIKMEDEFNAYRKLLGIKEDIIRYPMMAFEVTFAPQDNMQMYMEEDFEIIDQKLREGFISASGDYMYLIIDESNVQWRIVAFSLKQQDVERLKSHCGQKIYKFIRKLNDQVKCKVFCKVTHSVQRVGDLVGNLDVPEDGEYAKNIGQVEEVFYEKLLSRYKLFVMELDLGNMDQISRMIDNMVQELLVGSIEQAKFIVKNLFAMISEEYGQRELDVWKLTEGMFDYNVLQSVTDFNDLAASMKEVFWFLHTALEKKKMDYNSDVVGAIIQYIEQNLSGDLGNETIARKFRLSSGYMGRLFKQMTEENLSDYVLRIRMEKAVTLLRSGSCNIAEISSKVGYGTQSYFGRVFKKYTGYTPTDYCRSVLL